MKELQEEIYDTVLESSDWRWDAAICGLVRYLDYIGEFKEVEYEVCEDFLKFHSADITKEEFLRFVEAQYPEDMHHVAVKNGLKKEKLDEEDIKKLNARLAGNSIMKKYMPKLSENGENKEEIVAIIKEHRLELIQETYRNKANLYANFANPSQLFKEGGNYARLVGFYIDGPKKGKSKAYNFDSGTFKGEDSIYFDFIPFAFTIGRESIFINANSGIKELISSNKKLRQKVLETMKAEKNPNTDTRKAFFKAIIESNDFMNYDVEIILKDRENDFYETLILRKKSIHILKQLKERYAVFCFSYKKNETYLNVQKEVTNAIVNLYSVDSLIELFLGEDNQAENSWSRKYEKVISNLIYVNVLIHVKEERQREMNRNIFLAKDCAKKIRSKNKISENKIKAYRNKLSSALTFKDYDRFCMVLINLATYTELELDFAYDLFKNFEENKDIAYAFVMALGSTTKEEEEI